MKACIVKGKKERCHVLRNDDNTGSEDFHYATDDNSFFMASVFLEPDNVTARLCTPKECEEVGFPFVASTARGGKAEARYQIQKMKSEPKYRRQFGEAVARVFRNMGYKVVYEEGTK